MTPAERPGGTEAGTALATELRDGGVEFEVHVQPGASAERIGGLRDRALRVRVHAPPRDGEANAAVCRLVARALGVRPAAVQLRAGAHSRRKRLHVTGDSPTLASRLDALARTERPGHGRFDAPPVET